MKIVFFVKRAPLNSDVGSLTLPLIKGFVTPTFRNSIGGRALENLIVNCPSKTYWLRFAHFNVTFYANLPNMTQFW